MSVASVLRDSSLDGWIIKDVSVSVGSLAELGWFDLVDFESLIFHKVIKRSLFSKMKY